MRKILLLILSHFFIGIYAQQGDYQGSACQFDMDFIHEVVPDKDLTDLKFNEDIKSKKIKSIKIYSQRSQKLDSLYIHDKKYYELQIQQPGPLHHISYSFVRFFDYNKSGYCTSYKIYPVTRFFSKDDSLNYNQNYKIEFNTNVDTQIVSEHFKNNTITKRAYVKNKLIYLINNRDCMKMRDAKSDSVLIDEKQVLYTYFYKADKLDKILRNGFFYQQIDYPSNNSTKVRCKYIWGFQDTIEAECLTNFKNGKPIEKIFRFVNQSGLRVLWTMAYDVQGYCSSIKHCEEWDGKLGEEEFENKLSNTYKENRLLISEPKPSYLNYGESIKNTFYKNGLLKSKTGELGTDVYEYTFYD